MNTQDNTIDLFALTDSHQEARRLCCLFSSIIEKAQPLGKDTLICDGGDLFKGVYDRQLCIDSYLKLRRHLPQAQMVMAVGNNDFGFNFEHIGFLKKTAQTFAQNNIYMLCANLIDLKTQNTPDWIEAFKIFEINRKKIMVTAFCTDTIKLEKYGLKLIDIPQSLLRLKEIYNQHQPDAFIVINHALMKSSQDVYQTALNAQMKTNLIIGGHEHSVVVPDIKKHIYYPQAYNRTLLHFRLNFPDNKCRLNFLEEIKCQQCQLSNEFQESIEQYEQTAGFNNPVAESTLNLTKEYSDPSAIGTFIADKMRETAKSTLAIISTGYICHPLLYQPHHILTAYDIKRVFSAEVPLQKVLLTPAQLKAIFTNSVYNRYRLPTSNTKFLQCSQNVRLICIKKADGSGGIKQIIINNTALLDDYGNPIRPDDIYSCAIDPFIASGEQGYDVLRSVDKETLMKNNQLIKIKDIFMNALKEAETQYSSGSQYPTYSVTDIE